MKIIVKAKPIVWAKDGPYSWIESRYGYKIECIDIDDEFPYRVDFGSNDSQQFKTLENAQTWCQDEVDRWIIRNVLYAFQKNGG